MSSYPPRSYGWRVTLAPGESIEEFPRYGSPANRWEDLPLDEVERLELVPADKPEAQPVVRWRLADAALWVRGHTVDVVMGEAQLTRSPGELLKPVQRKKASSTYRPGQGSTTRLHGFLVGCRRQLQALDGAQVGVLAKVNPEGEAVIDELDFLDLEAQAARRVGDHHRCRAAVARLADGSEAMASTLVRDLGLSEEVLGHELATRLSWEEDQEALPGYV